MIPTRRAAAAAALALAAASLASCSSTPSPTPAAKAYLAAWAGGADASTGRLTDDPKAATAALAAVRRALSVTAVRTQLGKVTAKGDTATAAFTADLTLAGLGTWSYPGRLALQRSGGRWIVHWEPADINPRLTATTRLARTRTLPDRAAILDDAGQPLFAPTPVVTVGIEPARLASKNAAATYAALARALPEVDIARVQAQVKAAQPHAFVTVITLRKPAYEAIRSQIHDLPGTVFVEDTRLLAPTTDFGLAVLGRVGQATAQSVQTFKPDVQPGDFVGIGGLQEAFQRRLAGTASGAVVLADAQGNPVATLQSFPGRPGQPVRTTLDPRLQQVAEAALAGVRQPAALVAVRPSDGSVLAVANAPADSTYDRALAGRYPPGSTFKVVTTYALLGDGVTPATTVPCPTTVNVGGKVFHNFEGEASGAATFAEDFAISCNTAFVSAAQRLDPAALPSAASTFGFGADWRLPVQAFSGSVPSPADPVEKVADAIGQGRVETSVLGMALVAAAVQSGTARAPVLVTEPATPGPAPRTLDAGRVAALRSLMALVVTGRGTAAAAGLPPGTAGKTGTAEFGNANPPATHAWFIGFRGDLAVAVLVEGGGVGGAVAAPIAARFLQAAG